ncbi:MAG: hypothetical protein H6738_19945 [Alphaproteobacteria bacterium]|nr:hypothetical protein [Alphaproteobacteria bacterium]
MILQVLVSCTGPTDGHTSATDITHTGHSAPHSSEPTAETSEEHTGTIELVPRLELGQSRRWCRDGRTQPQHHAQIAYANDGAVLYVAYMEGALSGEPHAWLEGVDTKGSPTGFQPLGGPSLLQSAKPALVVDSRGRVVIAWQGPDGGVSYERVTPGIPTTELVEVQRKDQHYGLGNHSPDIALLPDDAVMISWLAKYGPSLDQQSILTRVVAEDLSPAALVVVDDSTSSTAVTPELVELHDSSIMLVYPWFSTTQAAIRMAHLDVAGQTDWIRPISSDIATRPQVALDPMGTMLAVTYPDIDSETESMTTYGVVDLEGTQLLPWSRPFANPSFQQQGTVAFLSQDLVLLVYGGDKGGDDGVWVSVLHAVDGAVIVPPWRLTPVGSYGERPSIAVWPVDDRNAKVAISWEQGELREVWGVLGTFTLSPP